jgi:uncharacterized protein YjiS (DUF1127 family)
MANRLQFNCADNLSNMLQAIAGVPRRVALTLEAWREHIALDCELAELETQGDLDKVLDDVGLSRSDIPRLLGSHPGCAHQLARMLEALRIAPQQLESKTEMREVELRCIGCATWRRCRDWLDSEAADDRWRDFCPNANVFAPLVSRRQAVPMGGVSCQDR